MNEMPNPKTPPVKVDSSTVPDMVVMADAHGLSTQYFVGQAVIWPARACPEDADRMENSLVERIGVEVGAPTVTMRSLVNGQTVKLMGLAGGTVFFYGPKPSQSETFVSKDSTGKDVEGKRYPLPSDCIRDGENIKHKSFAT